METIGIALSLGIALWNACAVYALIKYKSLFDKKLTLSFLVIAILLMIMNPINSI